MSSHAHERAILLLSFAAFAAGCSMRICDPMLPEFARHFAAGPSQVAVTVSAFALTYGLMQAVYGPLGDHLGKYRLVTFATLAGVIGNLAAMTSQDLNWLILGRILNGATAAAIIPLAMAWIGDNIDYSERQATLARFLLGQMFGLITGQTLGGLLADTLGWRWSFGFLALAYLGVGLALLQEATRNPEKPATGQRPRFVDQFRSVLSMPWARIILVVVFIEGMCVFAILAFVPSHLHHHFGLSLAAAGAIPATFGLGGISYAFLARRAVARMGETGLVRTGGMFLAAAGLILALAPHWVMALPAAFLLGAGFYMMHNTLQTHATQMSPGQRGTSVALFAACFFLGQFSGIALASRIAEKAGLPPVFAGAAFILMLLMLVFLSLLKKRSAAAKA